MCVTDDSSRMSSCLLQRSSIAYAFSGFIAQIGSKLLHGRSAMRNRLRIGLRLAELSLITVLMGSAVPHLAFAQATAAPAATEQSTATDVVHQNAVVAADHPAASQAGLEMLRQGGNVVDAAVATSFALSVVRPASCGIGGGGFMVIWNAERQEAVAIDYRERAPAAATRDMFTRLDDKDASRHGALAVAVPGTVAGLCFVAEKYGSLPLSTLLQPAIRLARDGVPIDDTERHFQASVLADLTQHNGDSDRFATLRRLYLNGGQRWPRDATFRSPLLHVLQRIAKQGRDGFYRGDVAESIVAEMRRDGGIITLEDLAGYQPTVRQPLRSRFHEHDIITMPPPSSGGVAIIEILNMLEAARASSPQFAGALQQHNSPEYIHLVTECMKHAFADRAEYLGDGDFVKLPLDRLTSPDYARQLVTRLDPDQTQPRDAYGRFQPTNDSGTSHFSIIDKAGNAVACTETINTLYGSYVVEPKFGIIFNNQMDDFSATPGQPNAFGLLQSEANTVAPHKRPLSSMSPTIVLRDGQARFVAGASGGPKIISATLQVLLNEILFNETPEVAIRAPRFHHQWIPETLNLEPELFDTAQKDLTQKRHTLKKASGLGVAQSVSRSSDGLRGASDPRKSGRVAGY